MPYFVEKNKKMIELRIKEIAKEKGMTLNDLAKKIGVTQPSISRMVNGVIMPSWDTLERIAKVLKVEPYELMSDAPRKDAEQKHSFCPHCNKPINVVLR